MGIYYFMDPVMEAGLMREAEARRMALQRMRAVATPELAVRAANIANLYPNLPAGVTQAAALSPLDEEGEELSQLAFSQTRIDAEAAQRRLENRNPLEWGYDALRATTRTAALLMDGLWEEIVQRPLRFVVGSAQELGRNAAETYEIAGPSQLLRVVDAMSEGETVNIGSGWLPNSTLSPETERALNQGKSLESAILNPEQEALGDPITHEAIEGREVIKMTHGPSGKKIPVSPGRLLAVQFIEPGTLPFNVVSGLTDFAANIYLDPMNAVFKGIGAARRAMTALSTDALIEGGARVSVHGPSWLNFLTQHRAGQRLTEYLSKEDDFGRVYDLFSRRQPGHRVDVNMVNKLVKETDQQKIAQILADAGNGRLTKGRQLLPVRPTAGTIGGRVGQAVGYGTGYGKGFIRTKSVTEARELAQQMAQRGHVGGVGVSFGSTFEGTWLGRMAANIGDRSLEVNDGDRAVNSFATHLKLMDMSPKERSYWMQQMARTGNGNFERKVKVVARAYRSWGERLMDEGVDPEIVDSITRVYRDWDRTRRYFTLGINGHLPHPGAVVKYMADGRAKVHPAAHLVSQFAEQAIPLASARSIRQVLRQEHSSIRRIRHLKVADGQIKEAAMINFFDFLMGDIWKPATLIRLAWPMRVILEEQFRMWGANLYSAFNHPLKWMAVLMGQKLDTNALGGKMSALNAFQESMSRSRTKDVFDARGRRAPHLDEYVPLETAGAAPRRVAMALYSEMNQLMNDDLSRAVAGALREKGIEGLDDVKKAFYKGELDYHRQKLMKDGKRWKEMGDQAAADGYVESVAAKVVYILGGKAKYLDENEGVMRWVHDNSLVDPPGVQSGLDAFRPEARRIGNIHDRVNDNLNYIQSAAEEILPDAAGQKRFAGAMHSTIQLLEGDFGKLRGEGATGAAEFREPLARLQELNNESLAGTVYTQEQWDEIGELVAQLREAANRALGPRRAATAQPGAPVAMLHESNHYSSLREAAQTLGNDEAYGMEELSEVLSKLRFDADMGTAEGRALYDEMGGWLTELHTQKIDLSDDDIAVIEHLRRNWEHDKEVGYVTDDDTMEGYEMLMLHDDVMGRIADDDFHNTRQISQGTLAKMKEYASYDKDIDDMLARAHTQATASLRPKVKGAVDAHLAKVDSIYASIGSRELQFNARRLQQLDDDELMDLAVGDAEAHSEWNEYPDGILLSEPYTEGDHFHSPVPSLEVADEVMHDLETGNWRIEPPEYQRLREAADDDQGPLASAVDNAYHAMKKAGDHEFIDQHNRMIFEGTTGGAVIFELNKKLTKQVVDLDDKTPAQQAFADAVRAYVQRDRGPPPPVLNQGYMFHGTVASDAAGTSIASLTKGGLSHDPHRSASYAQMGAAQSGDIPVVQVLRIEDLPPQIREQMEEFGQTGEDVEQFHLYRDDPEGLAKKQKERQFKHKAGTRWSMYTEEPVTPVATLSLDEAIQLHTQGRITKPSYNRTATTTTALSVDGENTALAWLVIHKYEGDPPPGIPRVRLEVHDVTTEKRAERLLKGAIDKGLLTAEEFYSSLLTHPVTGELLVAADLLRRQPGMPTDLGSWDNLLEAWREQRKLSKGVEARNKARNSRGALRGVYVPGQGRHFDHPGEMDIDMPEGAVADPFKAARIPSPVVQSPLAGRKGGTGSTRTLQAVTSPRAAEAMVATARHLEGSPGPGGVAAMGRQRPLYEITELPHPGAMEQLARAKMIDVDGKEIDWATDTHDAAGYERALKTLEEGEIWGGIRPPVLNAQRRSTDPGQGWWDRVVDIGFAVFMGYPTDKLSRSPAFKQYYWRRVAQMVPYMDAKTRGKLLPMAKKAGLDRPTLGQWAKDLLTGGTADYTWENLRRLADQKVGSWAMPEGGVAGLGEPIDGISSLREVDNIAKSFALAETKRLLYDFTERRNFFDMARHIFPFGDAWLEILGAWSRMMTQNPKMFRRVSQGVMAARNHRSPEEKTPHRGFFYSDPVTGEEIFNIPGGNLLASHLFEQDGEAPGVQPTLYARAQSINLALGSFMPGFGPLIQLPASEMGWLQDPRNRVFRDIILPYGAMDTESAGGIVDELAPSWFKKLMVAAARPTGDDQRLFNNTIIDVLRAEAQAGKVDLSTPEGYQAAISGASKDAQFLYMIRAGAQFGMPVSPAIRWDVRDKNGTMWGFQQLATEYSNILKENDYDHEATLSQFIDLFGVDPSLYYTPKSKAVVARTVQEKGAIFQASHSATFAKFPTSAYYALPDDATDAEFDYNTYLNQFKEEVGGAPVRQELAPGQWVQRRNDFLGRVAYEKARRAVGTRTDPAATGWLRDLKFRLIERYPGYAVPILGIPERVGREQVIAELEHWNEDEVLHRSETGIAVAKYMKAREAAMERATQQGLTPQGAFSANRTAYLREWLRSYAAQLIKLYPDFGVLWDQVLQGELRDDEEAALFGAADLLDLRSLVVSGQVRGVG